jgi:hypothetical protein
MGYPSVDSDGGLVFHIAPNIREANIWVKLFVDAVRANSFSFANIAVL